MAFSPDGHLLASTNADAGVTLWNVTDRTNPTARGNLATHLKTVRALVFSSDGRLLATTSTGTGVTLWDVTDPTNPTTCGNLATHLKTVRALAISPDSRLLATAHASKKATLWDITDPAHPTARGVLTTTRNPRRRISLRFADRAKRVDTLAFSPNGHLLVGGCAGTGANAVLIWDATDPGPLLAPQSNVKPTLKGSGGDITWFATVFSPDGRVLAAAGRKTVTTQYGSSASDFVVLWDVRDPNNPVPLSTITDRFAFGDAIAFSPQGHLLATGCGRPDQPLVILWDVHDPTLPIGVGALSGHHQAVGAVAFNPHGDLLAADTGKNATIAALDIAGGRDASTPGFVGKQGNDAGR